MKSTPSYRETPGFGKLLARAEQQHQKAASMFAKLEGERVLGMNRAGAIA